jgi:ferric-dicitrate binding protein FerR (iron transport regulator)
MSEASAMGERDGEFEVLIDALIDGRCDEADLRRLEALVREDPKARRAYLDQLRMHALLEWRHGRVEPGLDDTRRGSPSRWRFRRLGLRLGLAAVLVVGLGLAFVVWRHGRDGVATLVEARDVAWAGPGQPPVAGAWIAPGAIRCDSGTLRLAFDSGATVVVEGPADLRILSGMRLRAERGRITARVTGDLKGFAIETPSTLVVDQGTEFGVEVDAAGRTGVVVFRGLVDLERTEMADGPAEVKRLGQGEALRVDREGVLSRIVAVDRRPSDDGWSTDPSSDPQDVIRSVRDNLRGLESAKYYQIAHRGLYDDAPAYVDRPHEWNGLDADGLPDFLHGADYVMTFNDDKWSSHLEITVEVARRATLYVFLDHREKPPVWLTERFTKTGVDIGLDEGSWPDPTRFSTQKGPGASINQVFSVWRRDVGPDETIALGSLEGGKNNRAMYGIAAVARP